MQLFHECGARLFFAHVIGVMALSSACTPLPPQSSAHEEAEPLAQWRDDVLGVSILAPEPHWELKEVREGGVSTGVEVRASEGCRLRLFRRALLVPPRLERNAALEKRVRERLHASGIRELSVRDQGVVPLGPFSAWMMRFEGRDEAGEPWFARVLAAFVTRGDRRLYAEIRATSRASSLVARRTCFDALVRAVTLDAELR